MDMGHVLSQVNDMSNCSAPTKGLKKAEQKEQDRLRDRRAFEEIYLPQKGDLDYFSIEDRINYHFKLHIFL